QIGDRDYADESTANWRADSQCAEAMKFAAMVVLAAIACGQDLSAPVAGRALDSNGALRGVRGIAGAFFLSGPVVAEAVLASACGERFCLAKTESQVVSAESAAEAPAGAAVIAIQGDRAVIYFVSTGEFREWRAGRLLPVDAFANGDVVSI